MIQTLIQQKTDALFKLYEVHGDEDYGEGVTQLMHMVQCANLAKAEGYDDEIILAAFFHDIGHFLEDAEEMGIYGKQDHDRIGGEFLLQNGFPEIMAKLVASHVAAKRYLTYSISGYYEKLSEASKKTLEYQGGPMNAAEAGAFDADPLKELYLKIRYWDDLGKETDTPVNPKDIDELKERCFRYLLQRAEE